VLPAHPVRRRRRPAEEQRDAPDRPYVRDEVLEPVVRPVVVSLRTGMPKADQPALPPVSLMMP